MLCGALKHARYSDLRYWDWQQAVDLLVQLGKDGDASATETLRRKYQRSSRNGSAFREMLATGLIELDGLAGLKRVLRDQLRFNHEEPRLDFLLWVAQQNLGEEAVNQALPELVAAQPGLAERLQQEEQRRAERRQLRSRQPQTYDEIWALIQQLRNREEPGQNTLPIGLHSRLSSRDLRRLTQDLKGQNDVQTLRLLLGIFMRKGVPTLLSSLLELQAHPDGTVSFRAHLALARIQHPKVRLLALKLLQRPGKYTHVATDLMRLNFQPGDERFLEAGLRRVLQGRDQGGRHNFLMGLTDVAAKHPTPAVLNLLVWAYPHQTCSLCREKIIDLLLEHGALPEWLAAEAKLDANLEIRAAISSGLQ